MLCHYNDKKSPEGRYLSKMVCIEQACNNLGSMSPLKLQFSLWHLELPSFILLLFHDDKIISFLHLLCIPFVSLYSPHIFPSLFFLTSVHPISSSFSFPLEQFYPVHFSFLCTFNIVLLSLYSIPSLSMTLS